MIVQQNLHTPARAHVAKVASVSHCFFRPRTLFQSLIGHVLLDLGGADCIAVCITFTRLLRLGEKTCVLIRQPGKTARQDTITSITHNSQLQPETQQDKTIQYCTIHFLVSESIYHPFSKRQS